MAVLACASLAFASLPPPSRSALGPRYGGSLAVGAPTLPATLDLVAPADLATSIVAPLIHEPLLAVAADGIPRPSLAEGWTVGAEGREWSLRLRAGARFHDDRPVTAEDAVRSLRRFLRAGSAAASRLAASLEGGREFQAGNDALPGLTADGPLRLTLRFLEPRAAALAPLASPSAAVTGSSGAGAGAFIPATRTAARRLGLTAFGAHVRGRPFLDSVEVVLLPDGASGTAEVQSGRLDVAPGPPGVSAVSATLLLVLDPTRAPLNRLQVRQAISAAVDRPELVRHLLPGGDPAASLVVPALLPPLAAPTVAPAPALSGHVSIAVDRDVPPSVSRRVVAHLTALGLEVSVQPLLSAAARSARTQARLLLFRPEVPEAGLILRELAGLAPASSEADAALDAADRESNLDRRRAHLHRAEQALRADSCLIPLASAPVSFAIRNGIHGARVDLAGRLALEDAWREP
jgi:ABC-type transport system substrate-binding protein